MRRVHSVAQVDHSRCRGDRICENVCPTGAIRVVEKKAVVDERKCAACLKCSDNCPEDAIRYVMRTEPLVLAVSPSETDRDKIREVCRKAHLTPEDVICPCTMATASEVAAAILKGARTPEDISAMTGVRTACGMWCMALVQDLLRASGEELAPPKGFHWYEVNVGLWNIPEEVAQKYPEYRLEESRRLFQEQMDRFYSQDE